MLLQPILALVILNLLRKSLKTSGLLQKWNRLFMVVTGIFIALIILSVTVKGSRDLWTWISNALIAGLVYLVFYSKDFQTSRQVMFAALPLFIIGITEDILDIFAPGFYEEWINYFDAAEMFAFIWMVAMFIINSRQQKALAKERLKREEKEKEYRITESLKASLEIQVKERTAELTLQKEELLNTLNELKSTQSQLIQSEKMASLGELTAGIAHEIQNPLNFINNFSEINAELIGEMATELTKGNIEEARNIAQNITENEEKIMFHGKRADSIVKGMLQHSRRSSGQKEPTDINALADEYLRLAYHGLRAKDKSFNAIMKTDYDEKIDKINVIPQDIGRVILNLITNAFYVVNEKALSAASATLSAASAPTAVKYEPTVSVNTKKEGNKVIISVKDNGNGIPQQILDKIFQPFFTTKPTGQGTGLGLSMSYDIVTKGHQGELKVETKEGEGSAFTIILPV